MTARRSVDWSVVVGSQVATPVPAPDAASPDVTELLAAFERRLAPDEADLVCRQAVEVARARIGLRRAAVFLMDTGARSMLGTWGTNLDGEVSDERHLMFDVTEEVLDVFRRAEAGKHYTVLDNCPIVAQRAGSTEVVGRGWLACTPIRAGQARLGIMFNDAGLSAAPVDQTQQALTAILCSLLGGAIESTRSQAAPREGTHSAAKHPVVRKAVDMLARNPGLVGKEIAAALGISASRLVRLFKAEVGVSLVEYRNRLRVERFRALVDAGEHNLHQVARAAGFGSYAQCYRVFRETQGAAPSDFLRDR